MKVAGSVNGYLRALGLQRAPFPPTPDADGYFHTESLQRELTEAAHCLLARKGFVLMTGEVGTGKSTFVRRLIERVESEGAAVSLVLNTFLQGPALLAAVLRDFGLQASGDAATDLDGLDRFLLARWRAGNASVLIIDDAQNLSLESLELLRLLSSLESGQEKLLQIVLVGQPELAEHLAEYAIRQLTSRIVKHIQLRPFSAAESARYIDFRLGLAGAGGRIAVSAGALSALQRHSAGNPRRIHLAMDRCLYGLVAKGGGRIDQRLLAAAVAEAGFQAQRVRRPRRHGLARLGAALVLLLGGGLAAAAGLIWHGRYQTAARPPVPIPAPIPAPAPVPTPVPAPVPAPAPVPVPVPAPVPATSAGIALAACLDGLGTGGRGQVALHSQPVTEAQVALLAARDDVCLDRRGHGWVATWQTHDPNIHPRLIQAALRAHDTALAADFVDGYHGPRTRKALAAFQRRHDLPASGHADALTRLLLTSATTGDSHVRR